MSQLGRHASEPPSYVSARGVRVTRADGRELIDANSVYWNLALGYSSSALSSALATQADTLPSAHLYRQTHAPAVALAERLASIAPEHTAERVMFSNDGSGAVETALCLAIRRVERRPRETRTVLALRGGFHGDALAVRELGDFPPRGLRMRVEGLRVRKVAAPRLEARNVAKYVSSMRRTFERHRPVALFVEVVQAMSITPIDDAFLVEAERACREHDALLVVDEAATGIGRTGRMLGIEHAGLRPDLTVLAKALTAGWSSLGATLAGGAAARWLDEPKAFEHGHTTSGHPLACAIALATLDEVERRRLPERAARLGAEVLRDLGRAIGDRVVDVRGRGLFVGVELASTTLATAIRRGIEARGVLVGQEASVLTLVPPLVIDERDLEQVVGATIDTVRDTP